MASMDGRTVAITGATSGIGEVAAVRLAEMGAHIVFTARDRVRADATMTKLRAANPSADHAAILADLSRLSEMKRVGRDLAALPRLDVLVNNAGALFNHRRETADGLEMTFALNHMAYFVVTSVVSARLAPGARIVNVASGAHRSARLDFGDLQSKKGYAGFRAYANSKLCNILFTRELARRLAAGVTANCLHPGFVATRFGDQSGGLLRWLFQLAKPLGAISPEEGAKTIIHLTSSPAVEGISGEYFYKCEIARPRAAAQDDAAARRLWDVSERIMEQGG
jgi:NAD(P)-dependent dehydrogenase (short-subunit alcohol dehydrogenase family)